MSAEGGASFGGEEPLRTAEATLRSLCDEARGLVSPVGDTAWAGRAASQYRLSAQAMLGHTQRVCGDLGPVPGLLGSLADALASANAIATHWDREVRRAEAALADALAQGDTSRVTTSVSELSEVRYRSESATAEARRTLGIADRRVAEAIDLVGSWRLPVETTVLPAFERPAGVEATLPSEIDALGSAAKAAMVRHASVQLTAEIERLEVVFAFLRSIGVHGVSSGWVRELRRHRAQLRSWARSDRQFLAYDPSNGSRVVEVFGSLVEADHVAVLVPGMTNSEFNHERGLAESARALQRDDRDVAVVAWLGYDTPGSGPFGTGMLTLEAVSDDFAVEGAAELAAFVAWLRKRRADAHVTVIAHSYGSVVAAIAAARHGLPADDLVVVGSPGVPVGSATDLKLNPGATVWAGLAPWDPIDELAGLVAPGEGLVHGTNPVDPRFGAVILDFDDSSGHGGYFDDEGVAVLTAVVTGAVGPRSRRRAPSRRNAW